jgi:hypothetical protein
MAQVFRQVYSNKQAELQAADLKPRNQGFVPPETDKSKENHWANQSEPFGSYHQVSHNNRHY